MHFPRLVETEGNRDSLPRWINVVAGSWLVVSAFAWPRDAASLTNAVLVGAVISGTALLAMFKPHARYGNMVLAVWLLVSTLFLIDHAARATIWHDAFVAVIVLGASLARGSARTTVDRHRAAHA